MTGQFDYFVMFAEMRTGSNFLETNLNALDGVTCHGEAFNPSLIGYPDKEEILGVDIASRDKDPVRLVDAIRNDPSALAGFRYFHDHDPRILDGLLQDRRCAKIILTRNPVESYVSWKIAQATGQWKLTDVKRRKEEKALFEADEFDAHVAELQQFQVYLQGQLQRTGQAAFYVGYEDLQSVEIMNGLAAYLGVSARLEGLDKTLKKQNPSALADKVANFDEMQASLAGVDRFNLTRTPNFEPRRGPVVPSYVAAAQAPLLYVPIKGGPTDRVEAWLAALDGVEIEDLQRKMSQKDLRKWKRGHPGHRGFTVIRHPVARAHHVFCSKILGTGPESLPQIRRTLKNRYNLPLPDGAPDTTWTVEQHRTAFVAFLEFLKGNLAGQTGIRVDASWCSQTSALQGFAEFLTPDLVLREDDIERDLPEIAAKVGASTAEVPKSEADAPFPLADVYDDEIESLTKAAYQRDYVMLGFEPWRGG